MREKLQRAHGTLHSDFVKRILPGLLASHRMRAYDFADNVVPDLTDSADAPDGRGVGTTDAYFDAHLDTTSARPKFRLAHPEWPIHARAELSGPAAIQDTQMNDSVVGANCIGQGAWLQHARLRRYVQVENEAQLDHEIVMDRSVVGCGARIVRAIIDKGHYTPAGEWIGIDPEQDRLRFHVRAGSLVMLPRGHFSQVSA
ncbi:MAG: hypothetical protein H7274_14750 [Rhodoferax sp.]|nr:hypothetical protein [Rhodoferax sp.]